MKENKIIDFFQKQFPIIGDDAAVINGSQIISKDLLVEDVHFRLKYFGPNDLAHKIIHVNLSDIAAMGGKAIYVLLGLSIPKNITPFYIEEFSKSFSEICIKNNLVLIGGDTTSSPDKLFISVTIIGSVDKPIYRNTAQIGDIICYSGNLGYAHIGLQALEQKIPGLEMFKSALLRPNAALQMSLEIKDKATAMMDISDGLYIDLKKLCIASKVSAQINLENLEHNEDFAKACKLLGSDPVSVQLMGGEDYGLLFTVKPEEYTNDFKKIGMIIAGNGEILFEQKFDFKQQIFSHFGEL